jgi:translocator protein
MGLKFVLFLLINFTGLAVGSIYTSGGVSSPWYNALLKAPWTPPGWVFGLAWAVIMICFSLYISLLWKSEDGLGYWKILFGLSWILNVLWNPLFFGLQAVGWAQVVIFLLLIAIVMLFQATIRESPWVSLLLLPYIVWLCIACSLNLYIYVYN